MFGFVIGEFFFVEIVSAVLGLLLGYNILIRLGVVVVVNGFLIVILEVISRLIFQDPAPSFERSSTFISTAA